MFRLDTDLYTNVWKCVFDGDLLASCGGNEGVYIAKVDIYRNIHALFIFLIPWSLMSRYGILVIIPVDGP